MPSIYVLDVSGYLYRCYHAIPPMTNPKGESTNALYGFARSLTKLLKEFQPVHCVAVFDGPSSAKSREAIYPDYKIHRAAMPMDLRYQVEWARELCDMLGIPHLNIPGVEADDTMGTIAKWAEKKGYNVYLCSSDKDLCQLVSDKVVILNPSKDNQKIGIEEVKKTYGVKPAQIIDFLSITGDTSDNVPGMPGFGPKTAADLLNTFGSLDVILASADSVSGAKKQQTIKEYGEQAKLSRQLVTIDTQVDIPKELNFFEVAKPDLAKLREFYGRMNFHSLVKEISSEPPAVSVILKDETPIVPLQHTLVDDQASLQHLIQKLSEYKEICFYIIATSSIQPITAEAIGFAFCVSQREGYYVPVNGSLGLQKVLEALKPLFENASIAFYSHNVKFHYQILGNYGIKIAKLDFDTVIASYLLYSQDRKHDLDDLIFKFFNETKRDLSTLFGKGKQAVLLQHAPLDTVALYACEEVTDVFRLKPILERELRSRKLDRLFNDLEFPLLRVLASMERHGIFLDQSLLATMSKEVNSQLQQLAEEAYQQAGEIFNLNSPKQLSEVLQKLNIKLPKKTATGFSTNAEVLESLRSDYPIAGTLLEYRALEKLRSTYIESLPNDISPKTGRIHCTFNQFVAATGRLSCQDPNLQNIPVRTEIGRRIREAFRPQREGWSYLAGDYSQVELRLLAHFSEDPTLIEAFSQQKDIHAHTAATLLGIPVEEVTKEMRNSAKAVNFGIIYGQEAYGLSQALNIPRSEAAQFISMYFKRYPRVKDYLESSKEKARQTGKSTTITGRERLIPEIHSKNMQIRIAAERLAINTPLQGTAADLIKLAMLQIDQLLYKEKKLGYMILQVHDELIFEVPDFEILSLEPQIRTIMQNVFHLRVPLIVDISIGKNWKEC